MASELTGTTPHGLILDEVHEPPSWFVLIIEPQQEVKVFTQLRSYGLNVYLPLVPSVVTRGCRRAKSTVWRPMMRGYLFVEGESLAEGMIHIHRQPAVHRFLRFGDVYAVVPDWQMERVRNQEEEAARPKPVQADWSVGEVARIGDGPFWSLNATIIDLANNDRITVEVSLLGRSVPMSVDASILEKL